MSEVVIAETRTLRLWTNDTRVGVTDVPILHPIIIGIACRTVSEFALATLTKPTTMDVEVEELWTRTVTKIPTIVPSFTEKVQLMTGKHELGECKTSSKLVVRTQLSLS